MRRLSMGKIDDFLTSITNNNYEYAPSINKRTPYELSYRIPA